MDNVNNEINNTFEQIKTEISQQVMSELASKNIDVIAKDYDAGAEVAKLINSYNATINDIENQINKNRYKIKDKINR